MLEADAEQDDASKLCTPHELKIRNTHVLTMVVRETKHAIRGCLVRHLVD